MKVLDRKVNLVSGFVESMINLPDEIALEVHDKEYSYAVLGKIAGKIAATIHEYDSRKNALILLLTSRSIVTYSGCLGILLSGKGYVPLNPGFPCERTLNMLKLSGSTMLIVGKECLGRLEELLPHHQKPLTVILPDVTDRGCLEPFHPDHKFLFSQDLEESQKQPHIPDVDPGKTAYLLFTSGSTGVPKGVPVSHKNIGSYIEYISKRYHLSKHDRCSQIFDMTFDLSVHDLFVCWRNGGTLCSIPKKFVMAPGKFIKEKELTTWFSVPSVGLFMDKMHMLEPNMFKKLRVSLFCGEPLPTSLAMKWQLAAPNSVVENLYGPTEATVAISHYRWNQDSSPNQCKNGIVPIGNIFEGQQACLIDSEREEIRGCQEGELALSGSQVTQGYFNNSSKTKDHFITLSTRGTNTWYRTGDFVRQDECGCLYFQGRLDDQVKILGHRVELLEIDGALRSAAEEEMAISCVCPDTNGNSGRLVGVVRKGNGKNEKEILDQCKRRLPDYMVPKRIHFVEQMPLNDNGKIDRKKLRTLLNTGEIDGKG